MDGGASGSGLCAHFAARHCWLRLRRGLRAMRATVLRSDLAAPPPSWVLPLSGDRSWWLMRVSAFAGTVVTFYVIRL